MIGNELKPDAVMKNYLRNNERFVAMVNYWLAPGRDVIIATGVKELDTDVAAALSNHRSLNRNRDIIKKATIEGKPVIICIENQQTIDKMMIYRDFEYSLLKYKSLLENTKELIPLIALVIYYGQGKWKQSKEMFTEDKIPSILKERLNNWKIFVQDVKEIDGSLIENEEVRSFVEAVQELYKWDGQSDLKDYQLTIETAIAVGAVTGTQAIIDQALKNQDRGGTISMCRSVDIALANSRTAGIKIGRIEGIKEGKKEGIAEGIKKERQNLVVRQLKRKLINQLSKETIGLISEASLEQLDNIAMNIFEINQEKDVIEILMQN